MLLALLLSTTVAVSPGPQPSFASRQEPVAQEQKKEEPPVKEVLQPKQDEPKKPEDPKHAADLERDIKVGKKYAEQVEKELKLTENDEYQARLVRVAEELIPIVNKDKVKVTWGDARLNPFKYQFKVVKGDEINAFSLPGGFIYFYEGLMKYADSDDELAGVVAHEIAHASLRHVATLDREAGKLQLITLPAILVALLTGSGELLQGTQMLQMTKGSGWSIQAEEASDYAALQYLQKSKYNPVAILTFMERLARDKRYLDTLERNQGILQTHPISRERADNMNALLTKANIPVKRSKASKSFAVEVKPGDKGVEAWFNKRRIYTFAGTDALQRASEAKENLEAFFDHVPELYDVQVKDSQIVGLRKVLFEIDSEDAKAAGSSKEALSSKTLQAIRQSLYNLAYRVWDTT